MTAKVSETEDNGLLFWCPGCKTGHRIVHGDGRNLWKWNGNFERPTITPSVLVKGGPNNTLCHSYVTAGRIQFLGDSTHQLSGQVVDLPDWPPHS